MNTTKLIPLLTTIIVCLFNVNAFGQASVNDQDSYVLAVNYNGEWFAMGQTISTNAASAIKIQVKDNYCITTSDINRIIWTFTKESKGLVLKTEGNNFLKYDSKNKTTFTLSPSSSGNESKWLLNKQNNGSYTIESVADKGRYVVYNKSSNGFRYYNAETYIDAIDFYLLPICQKDEATKSLTLKCTWTAEKLNSLDLSDITSADMRNITVPTGYAPTNVNPNCLFYVSQTTENANNLPNQIKVDENNNATAENIILRDGYDFYNKIPFRGNITYTRHLFDGWSTLTLPFPYTIHEEHIEEYADANSDYIHFTNTTGELAANKAYLIYMDAITDQTFSAANVEIPVTASTGNTFISNFITFIMPQDDNLYKLNNEGTEFNHSDSSAKVGAFRAYLNLSGELSNAVPKRIIHDKGNATLIKNTDFKIYQNNNLLSIHTEYPQNIGIYSLDGRKVYSLMLNTGTNYISVPLKGLYLINKQKIVFN